MERVGYKDHSVSLDTDLEHTESQKSQIAKDVAKKVQEDSPNAKKVTKALKKEKKSVENAKKASEKQAEKQKKVEKKQLEKQEKVEKKQHEKEVKATEKATRRLGRPK